MPAARSIPRRPVGQRHDYPQRCPAPGPLRTQAQSIVVVDALRPPTPDALTEAGLQALFDEATRSGDVPEDVLDLFVDLAKAQPFEDGNKRTAVIVANSLLIGSGAGVLLTIPVDDNDPSLAQRSTTCSRGHTSTASATV